MPIKPAPRAVILDDTVIAIHCHTLDVAGQEPLADDAIPAHDHPCTVNVVRRCGTVSAWQMPFWEAKLLAQAHPHLRRI